MSSGTWQGYVRVLCMLNCFSGVRLSVTPWPVACQAPLSMGFFRHEYWSGLPSCSRGSSQTRDWTSIPCGFFTTSDTWEAHAFLQMKSLLSVSRKCSKSRRYSKSRFFLCCYFSFFCSYFIHTPILFKLKLQWYVWGKVCLTWYQWWV